MRKHVMDELEIPQEEIDAVFNLVIDIIIVWQKGLMTLSEAFQMMRLRIPNNVVHDYLHYAFLISESGCDPELTDVLLEVAQRKIEFENNPSFQQVAQIVFLRNIIPYIQKKPNLEKILSIYNTLCSTSLSNILSCKIIKTKDY
ncbi:MAG: hypothetical protein LBI19_03875 [Oscillospiraceae bacterium]|nr:hypothetical protein [Oscillospiraceae bacterium]